MLLLHLRINNNPPRYIYDGLEGLGPDLAAFHSRLQMMGAKEYPRRHDSFDDIMSSSRDGISAKLISDDFCIKKLFDATYLVKNFPSYASVQLFRYALKSLWVPKYFPPKSKAAVLELWSTIKTDLEKVFQESSWMDDTSKQRMIEKLEAIQFQGGYPDEMLKKEEMLAYHNKFLVESLEDDSFIENQVNLFSTPHYARSSLGRPVFPKIDEFPGIF